MGVGVNGRGTPALFGMAPRLLHPQPINILLNKCNPKPIQYLRLLVGQRWRTAMNHLI